MSIKTAVLGGFAAGALAVGAAIGAIGFLDGDDDDGAPSVVQQPSATATTAPGSDDPEGVALVEECITAADIYENVRDSVVAITAVTIANGPFGQQEGVGTGTGFVIDEDGHILTNNHVAGTADTLEVRFEDGTVVEATLVGSDPANDLAVIRVNPAEADLLPATMGNSDKLRVGEQVLALGNPFNLEGTLTQGIVSGVDRTYSGIATTRPLREMIQTDAPINPGNSGGPLLNCRGEVVGINTLLENPTGQNVNVGVAFSVAIDTAKRSLSDMLGGSTVDHPWLGIGGVDVTPAVAESADLTVESGVYLTLVSAGSPADEAGLVGAFGSEQEATGQQDVPPGGDVITEVDGEAVTGIEELAAYLDREKDPGDTVELTVVRDGEELTLTATLAQWPS